MLSAGSRRFAGSGAELQKLPTRERNRRKESEREQSKSASERGREKDGERQSNGLRIRSGTNGGFPAAERQRRNESLFQGGKCLPPLSEKV